MKKLSNNNIDKFLIDNNIKIKRIDNFINISTKINWMCLTCNYIWKTKPNNIKSGNKCPKCSKRQKLNNEDVDNFLIHNNIKIKRIDNFKNNITKINWMCLHNSCNYIWNTAFKYIKNEHTGCPKCAGKIKFTNSDIDNYLISNNRNIERLDDYKNIYSKISWRCLNCSELWKTSFGSIKNNNTNCPKCYGSIKFIDSDIDNYLISNNRNIERLDEYKNIYSKINWKCLKCSESWKTSFYAIKNNNTCCPKCSKKIKPSNKDIDNYLLENNRKIIRIDSYLNNRSKIKWQCVTCLNIWEAAYCNIRGSNSGCPKCAPQSKNEKITYDLLKKLNLNIKSFKIKLSHNKKYTIPDFWLPDFNLIIEINGEQHYRASNFSNRKFIDNKIKENFKKQQIRDNNLRIFCKNHNINLLEINSSKYKNKEKFLKYLIEKLTEYKALSDHNLLFFKNLNY